MDKDRYQIIVLYNVNYYYVTSIIAHTKKKSHRMVVFGWGEGGNYQETLMMPHEIVRSDSS